MKVDAAPIRDHVSALLARGATVRGIAQASGVDARVVGRLNVDPATCAPKGGILTLDAGYAARLLAVDLSSAEAGETVRRSATRAAARRRPSRPALIGEPVRPRTRREAVDCAIEVAKLHALPLDAFVARQLDVTVAAAQDLLRQARCDGLLPQTFRARGRA